MTLFTIDIIGTMGTATGNPAHSLAEIAQRHNPAPFLDGHDPDPLNHNAPNPWTPRAAEINRWLLNTTPELDQATREAVSGYLMFPAHACPTDLAPDFRAFDYTAQALDDLCPLGDIVALSNLSVLGGPALVRDIKTQLGHLVPQIYTSYTLGFRKPHPSCWRQIADDNNTTVNEIIHIGDLIPEDILGAINAGCHCAILVGPQGKQAPPWLIQHPRVRIVPDLRAAAATITAGELLNHASTAPTNPLP